MTYEEELNERVNRAVDNYMQGYNCSQSVVEAFADMYGFNREQALRMSASFGSGMSRMRMVCGACCGIMQLAGLEVCALDGADKAKKSENYDLAQTVANEFKEEHTSIICPEILRNAKNATPKVETDTRNAENFAKRPCARRVASAARIWAKHLLENHSE